MFFASQNLAIARISAGGIIVPVGFAGLAIITPSGNGSKAAIFSAVS